MLGSMDITKKNSPWPAYVIEAVRELNDQRVFTYIAPFKGTKGHPKVKEHKLLAEGLISFINDHIQW